MLRCLTDRLCRRGPRGGRVQCNLGIPNARRSTYAPSWINTVRVSRTELFPDSIKSDRSTQGTDVTINPLNHLLAVKNTLKDTALYSARAQKLSIAEYLNRAVFLQATGSPERTDRINLLMSREDSPPRIPGYSHEWSSLSVGCESPISPCCMAI